MQNLFRSIGLSVIVAGSFALATDCLAQTGAAQPSAVVVPVHMLPKQMIVLATVMHSDHNSCYLQDLQPEDDSSMVLICGVEQPRVSFSP